MFVKLILEDLNFDFYPPYPTSTYTYGVTIASRVCDGECYIFEYDGNVTNELNTITLYYIARM